MIVPVPLAFVITELEFGGAERCLVRLACGMARRRFSPSVYCLAPRPAAGQDQLVRQLEASGIPVHFLGLRSAWQFPFALFRLRREWSRQAPAVVQSFLFHANVVSALTPSHSPRPAIVSGVRVADPAGWRRRTEAWTSRRVDRVVCVSRSVADFCAAQAGFPQDKLVVIPNGIDVDALSGARGPIPEGLVGRGRRMLLFVGRLHPQKALDWLLSLAPDLLMRLSEHDLVLVGQGPQQAELERMVAAAGLESRVHFAGWRADIPELLAACDLLLLPSRWEGMPNIVLEAMAGGRPVCATRADGVQELLGGQSEAQTADFGDRQRFIANAVRLVQDRQLATRIGQANRRRAAEQFSLTAMIRAYEQLYEHLLSPARGTAGA